MLQVNLNLERAVARLDSVSVSINTVVNQSMPSEFYDWQVHDVHRRFPIVQKKPGGVTTVFVHGRNSKTGRRRRTGRAPIIRSFLMVKLRKRMQDLLAREIKW
jgi:hypothetical protein